MKTKDIADDLKRLSSLIQRSKDLTEAAQIDLTDFFSEIHKSCVSFEKSLEEKLPVELALFERDSHDWQAAWKKDKELLLKLGEKQAITKRRGETPLKFGKRLLVELLQRPEGIAWRQSLAQEEKKSPDIFVKDPEANEALKRWGKLSLEAFELDIKSAPPALVKRSADVLGINFKKINKSFAKELHAAARRFANNTTLF